MRVPAAGITSSSVSPDSTTSKHLVSNVTSRQTIEQKTNSLLREVPQCTPELDGSVGSVQQPTNESCNEFDKNTNNKNNVITSKLQILDGEKRSGSE